MQPPATKSGNKNRKSMIVTQKKKLLTAALKREEGGEKHGRGQGESPGRGRP